MAAEYSAVNATTLAANASLPFLEKVVADNGCRIMHRNGSSNITLRGKGRYRVSFNANITGAINTQLVLAMAVDGEPVTQAIMGTSVGTAGLVNNVASSILVNVPCNCCSTISIKNNGAGAVTVYNANIVIEEV